MVFNKAWVYVKDVGNFFEDVTDKAFYEIEKFIFSAFLTAFAMYVPASASIKFLIVSTVAKAVLDFEIDFENGHFWG